MSYNFNTLASTTPTNLPVAVVAVTNLLITDLLTTNTNTNTNTIIIIII